jgi:uncharacterized protein (TIGR03437 family)
MSIHSLRGLGILVLVGLMNVPALFGTEYTYTKIADNAPGSILALGGFIGPFLINSSGEAAFTAQQSGGTRGIYTGSGNALNTVVAGDSPRVLSVTAFNDSGVLVFETPGSAVYTATLGGTPFQVSTGTGTSILPSINNAGTVAYGMLSNSILARTGSGAVQTLVSETDLMRANALSAPLLAGLSINNSGRVAFYATGVQTGTGCSCGIFTVAAGSPAMQVSPFQQNISIAPQINDTGAVVFAGTYQNVKGVFIASGGQVAAAVDLGAQVVSLGHSIATMNNKGEVVYWAKFGISPFVEGIFTGPDKVADKVIGTGDPLFGSVVSDIFDPQNNGRFLNDSGQVVFNYGLSNGVRGIAVATPVSSGAALPKIAANGIVNGASFASDAPAAPGAIVSIFGDNFIAQLAVPSGDPLPVSLQGVSVTFSGIPAPIFFVAPGQINVQVPFGVSGPAATVVVTTPAGTSNSETINIAPASPAVFTTSQNGSGQGVVVFGNTATIVGPIKTGTDWRPAKTGDTITIYANGLGAVNPPINDGWNSCDKSICAPDLSNLTLRYTNVRPVVKIGGVTVPDNLILFSGFAPQFAGLYQINLTIPDGITPSNQVPVSVQMGSITSSAVSIAMQ